MCPKGHILLPSSAVHLQSPHRQDLACVQTSVQSPSQNGVTKRWVGSCRREFLDQVIPLNERHLKRLLAQYLSYYHDDRTLEMQSQPPCLRSAAGHLWSVDL